jgi:hypothetical protein
MTNQTCEGCDKPTTGAILCDTCAQTLAYAIANIGVYYDDLGTVQRKQTRYASNGATKGSIGKSQPLPVDLRFVDAGEPPKDDKSGRPRPATIAPGTQLRWDTWNTLTAWTRTILRAKPPTLGPVCERPCLHLSCTEQRRRQLPHRLSPAAMCHYLAVHHHWATSQTFAPVMLSELHDLELRLRRLVDRRPDRWYAGRCGAHDLLENVHCEAELYAEAGRTTITCPSCDTTHDVTARREFLLTEAKDYLVTATEAAGALMSWTDYDGSERNLIGRISKWHERQLIEAKGTELINGRECRLYRLGDLQDRLVDDAQRQQTRRLTQPNITA